MFKPILLSVSVALGAFVASTVQADTAVTTAPGALTYMGTVTEVNPSSSTMILTSPSSPSPVTYTYTPQTVFIDADGKTVSYEVIKNSPVRVEYVTEGGKTVVRRVVVSR